MYQNTLDRLSRQKEDIENLIKSYQNMAQPVNNYINTAPGPNKDLIEWRVLNENEEVDNLYVQNKTLFINDNMMILKGIDGSLEKWEIKKTYPIDKKDQKINELEEEIKKLKEMMSNEYSKPTSAIRECKQSNADVDINAESRAEKPSEPIPREEPTRAGRGNCKSL